MTIPELKVFLEANKLKVSGKKDDLIERIRAHVAQVNE
jgi:hypothetical protein